MGVTQATHAPCVSFPNRGRTHGSTKPGGKGRKNRSSEASKALFRCLWHQLVHPSQHPHKRFRCHAKAAGKGMIHDQNDQEQQRRHRRQRRSRLHHDAAGAAGAARGTTLVGGRQRPKVRGDRRRAVPAPIAATSAMPEPWVSEIQPQSHAARPCLNRSRASRRIRPPPCTAACVSSVL
jgi:hypothetical protein